MISSGDHANVAILEEEEFGSSSFGESFRRSLKRRRRRLKRVLVLSLAGFVAGAVSAVDIVAYVTCLLALLSPFPLLG